MRGHNCSRIAGLITSILFAICVLAAKGATIVWINPNGGNWNVPANWSPTQVPGPGDIALIGVDGTYTVTQNVSAAISGLAIGQSTGGVGIKTLRQASAVTLTVDGSGIIYTNGHYNLGAGTFGGTGPFAVEGAMTWSGGAIGSGRSVSVASEASLNLAGTGTKTLNGTITNAGTMRWSGSGTVAHFQILGHVHNLAGGLFEIQNDQFVDLVSGAPTFVNEGVIRKTLGIGTTTWQVPLINSGVVEAQVGVISWAGGSIFNSGSQFLGVGINRCGNGTVFFEGDIFSENLEWSGAVIRGTNTVSGTASWLSGSVSNSVTVATNGTLLLAGTGTKTLTGTITNRGTMRWSGSGSVAHFQIIGRMHNLAGALFEIQNNQFVDLVSGTPQFINEGVIRKIILGGTTTWEVPLINNGTLDTQTGFMTFAGGSVFNNGSRFEGAGTNRCGGGTVTFNGDIFSENLEWAPGVTIAGTSTVSGTNTWLGGIIAGAVTVPTDSTLLLAGTAAKTLNGSLTNGGTIRWSGSGTVAQFQIVGRVHNLTGALFEIRNNQFVQLISGTPVFINEGTIRKTVGGGTTTWQVPLINNGIVDAQAGLMALAGGSIFNTGTQLLGAGTNSCAGGAVTFNGDILSENLEWHGATINGTSAVSGTLRWLSGVVATTAAVSVPAGSTLLLAGTAAKTLNGSLTNGGTIYWSGSGTVAQFQIVGRVHNLTGALFEIRNNQFVQLISGTPVFINEGTIRKTVGGGTTTWQVPLINRAIVDVQAGLMAMASGSVFNTGSQLLGAGTNSCGTGTVTFSGDIVSENLEWNGATINGTSTISGTVRWLSGIVANTAAVTVPAGSTLLLAGTAPKTLNGSLTNSGTMRWSGSGSIANFQIVGRVHNLAGALFEIQNNQVVDFTTGTPQFVNEGIIRKTVGGGTTTWQVPLINSGIVDVQAGVMSLAGGSAFNTGTRFVGAGVTTMTSGTMTLNGEIYSDNLQLAGATITGSGSFNGSLDWLSGTLQAALNLNIPPTGLLRMRSTGIKTINGSVTNAGTILWEGTGDLQLVGSLHNLPTGLFEARNNEVVDFISGTPEFVNEGVFRKTLSVGTTTFQVRMLNWGTVETASGTVILAPGSVFNTGTRFTGAGVTVLNSGTITLSGDIYSENLQLAGATITGSGSFNGSLDWLSGTLQASLNLSIPTNGLLRLRGTGLKVINGTVTNAGTILWEGTGNLQLVGSLHNLLTGLFEARNDQVVDFTTGDPEFVNEGVFRKTNSIATTTFQVRMLNWGTVDTASGTVVLAGGSVFNSGTRFTGGGIATMPSGTMTLNGDIYSENLQLNGATVTGSGSFTGSLDWLSGTLQAALNLTIPTNGTLRLRSTGIKTINGAVTNSGNIRWEGTGDLQLLGVLHNLSSGVFEARNDEVIDFVSGTPRLINDGTFRKAAGTNITTCQILFRNFGVLEVNSGTLSLTGGITNRAGHVVLGGGRLQLPAAATLRLNGGSLSGQGTLLAHLFNDNLVSAAGSNGVLTISGNYTQAVTGTLSVNLGGLDPGTNHSWMRVTGRASLDGTLDVALAPDFLPAISNSFRIATWTVNSGMFKCYNGLLLLGDARRLVPEYNPGNITLTTVEATEPQPLRVGAHRLSNNQVLICWPSEFLGHTLQSTTNLSDAAWINLTNSARVFLHVEGTEKYFRTIGP